MIYEKADGCDRISVTVLQLCALEVALPLQINFQKCMNMGMFPDSWKYANVQPIHKKDNRQIIIDLFHFYLFAEVYSYLNTHNLLSKYQCGFMPRDSTIIST